MRQNHDRARRDPGIPPLAAAQHGVVTRAQLNALGLDGSAIRRRMSAGHLHQVHRNVYAVGHPRLTLRGRWLAAVMSFGEGAVLSHPSAAMLWRIVPEDAGRIHVTVPRGGGRGPRRDVIVHRSSLGPDSTVTRERIPVTKPARTLVDLADCCTRRELERAFDEATYLGLDLTPVQPLPGRRGSGLLREVLEQHAPGTTRTKSQFEERLLALCRDRDVERPLVNQVVEGFEVDFAWPGARLIVEADSWSAHGRRSSFERDRMRDARLQVAGWRVVRVTWRRLAQEPAVVARQLAALIAARPGP